MGWGRATQQNTISRPDLIPELLNREGSGADLSLPQALQVLQGLATQ